MFGRTRRHPVPSFLGSSLVLVAVAFVPATARAWVERTVKSDSVTVDIDRDGSATVTHEILLSVRGGPLPEFSFDAIDADAEMLDGATVTLAQSGRAAGYPIPLSAALGDRAPIKGRGAVVDAAPLDTGVSTEPKRLTLHVVGIKGIRSGSHLIRFAYRTNLAAAGRLHPSRAGTTIEWNGPSFADGIDSAKVVFRLPRAPTPPRLGSSAEATEGQGIADDRGGVFLSTSRRASDKDELEVVRPHVAKEEIVSWRILADGSVFDGAGPHPDAAVAVATPVPVAPHGVAKRSPLEGPQPIAAAVLAIALGVVIVLKSRWVALACAARGATPRPLLPLPALVRAAAAGGAGLGAAALVVYSAPPWAFAAALIAVLVAATHLPPRAATPLRGPGEWRRLTPEAAFDEPSGVPPDPGRYFDASTPLGFVLFASLLGGFVAGAIVVMRSSAYGGLALALGSSVLFPLFFTGRSAELPPDPALAPRALLEWLDGIFEKDGSLEHHPLGRFPARSSSAAPDRSHDELRLLVLPRSAAPGFLAIEVGMDFHAGPLGPFALPFVIVRVLEGSKAAEALPRGLFWSRGRTADERVAVLRPRVPTRKVTARLVRDVARLMAASKPALPKRQSPKPSTERSAGKSEATANAGTTSSPAHAT